LSAFLLISSAVFSQGIDFNWSWGDFGFAYSNSNKRVNLDFSVIQLNWMETYTGLGLGLELMNWHYDPFWDKQESKISTDLTGDFLNIKVQYTPFSVKRRMGYLNIGIYDRFGFSNYISVFGNYVGINMVWTSIPIGRTNDKLKRNYNYSKTLFVEYNTVENTVRVGLKFDYLSILSSTLFLVVADYGEVWNQPKTEEK
jgi:hypothetical protein